MTNSGKSKLIEEIAPKDDSSLNFKSINAAAETTCVIVDFMSFVRGQVVNFNTFETFQLFVDEMFKRCTNICSHILIHFVFDSYISHSLKEKAEMNAEL